MHTLGLITKIKQYYGKSETFSVFFPCSDDAFEDINLVKEVDP